MSFEQIQLAMQNYGMQHNKNLQTMRSTETLEVVGAYKKETNNRHQTTGPNIEPSRKQEVDPVTRGKGFGCGNEERGQGVCEDIQTYVDMYTCCLGWSYDIHVYFDVVNLTPG